MKSKGKVIVVFNYCYSLFYWKIKELILDGKIGRVIFVDLNWYIDMYYGVSYFKCWNWLRLFFGGFFVYKLIYYFDFVNWWFG